MPFQPVLASRPQKQRNALFGAFALGVFVLVFFILGFILQDVFIPLLVAAPAGLAGAWALVGWPVVTRPDGRPLVEAKWKPFLFFPLALVFAFALYAIIGVFLTQGGVPVSLVAYVSLCGSIVLACAAAYFLVGFPHVIHAARHQYERIPPERRPFLFFPVFAVTFLVLYVGLGVGTTKLLSSFTDRVVFRLDIQVLLLLPFTLVASALVASLLVGFPKPQKPLRESLPKVTGKHRPRAFLATFLVAGVPLTVLVGALLTYAAASAPPGSLPDALHLPLALVLGYSLSLGLSAAVWGTPRRWRQYEDYTPGLSPRARLGGAAAAGFATALAVVVAFGIAGVDIFWGLLAGLILGLAVGLVLAGFHRRVAARRDAPTLVPELPDRAKSALLLTTWLVIALVVASVLTYALPAESVPWNILVALTVGLVVAFLMVEQGLLQEWRVERRRQREKRKAWAKRRKEALARGTLDEDEPPTNA